MSSEKLSSYSILLIEDDSEYTFNLKTGIKKYYPNFQSTTSLTGGFDLLNKNYVDCVLLDIGLPDGNGLEGLAKIKEQYPYIDVVMVTGEKDPKFIVHAVRNGASDYLAKPFGADDILAVLEKLEKVKALRDRHDALIANLNPSDTRARVLGSSPAFRDMLVQANKLRGHLANVLIIGESGTGKELLARYIHSLEPNSSRRPFIAVNCAAIPESLIESELFGYEKGAFTGANNRKIGKFELANSGDIFLDEISTLKHELQAKILRVLQEKEIVRVGGNTTVKTDFRVIAATNVDIALMVESGEFRLDLYHRLRVVQLNTPPLRDRKEDIPMLVAYFLEKYAKPNQYKKITAVALTKLQNYNWPGNVRELENVVHSMAILAPSDIIEEKHLPVWALNGIGDKDKKNGTPAMPNFTNNTTYKDYLRRAERFYIENVLNYCHGDRSRAAQAMNLGRTTLYSKLKELGIEEKNNNKSASL